MVSFRASRGPYSPNQILVWDFFCRFLDQTGFSRARHNWICFLAYLKLIIIFFYLHILQFFWFGCYNIFKFPWKHKKKRPQKLFIIGPIFSVFQTGPKPTQNKIYVPLKLLNALLMYNDFVIRWKLSRIKKASKICIEGTNL